MKKVLIIGIDGATFDVIIPMINTGRLTHLSNLIKGGTYGTLLSTIPPVTPPAWVSFMTGKNPGKHGVFDFYVSPAYGYTRPVCNSKYIKAKTIWKILSEQGLKIGIVNLPMSYPAQEINGFIIPGMQYSINKGKDFSYPPQLIQEIKKRVGEYQVVYGDIESLYTNNLDNFIKKWTQILEIRKQSILYLIEHKQWDIFMFVFYILDPIQHHFWKFFDNKHPLYDPVISDKYKDIIPEFYEKVDGAIGEILNKVDKDTTIIVTSDHGAGAEEGAFYINTWLNKEGFLSFKKLFLPIWQVRFPHLFYKILRKLGFPGVIWTLPLDKLKSLGKVVDPREGLNIPFFINWKKTKAYAGNHTEQGIYINLKGREPLGIVEKGKEYDKVRDSIIKRLKDLKDPITGKQLDIELYKKEEIYYGPYIDDAPDIFVKIKGWQYLTQKEIYHKSLFSLTNKTSGTHRMNGILILKGEGIRTNYKIRGAKIIDIAPTILYLLGIPIPEDMDGKVIDEIFTKEYLDSNQITYCSASDFKVEIKEGIFEESDKVKESLRALGYFG
jgi:predicted AlkP superfamily phosphohydrolase/phosphomutase